jgi:hypothetical protein
LNRQAAKIAKFSLFFLCFLSDPGGLAVNNNTQSGDNTQEGDYRKNKLPASYPLNFRSKILPKVL